MKKNQIFLFLSSILLLSGCGNSGAQLYHDNIYNAVRDCFVARNDAFTIYYDENPKVEDILDAIKLAIESCQLSKETVESIWDYKKDSSFKDAVIDYLSADIEYLTIYADSSRFWDIETLNDEDASAYQETRSQLLSSQEVLMSNIENMSQSQKDFVSKYGVKLEKDRLENSDQQNEESLDEQWSVEGDVNVEIENSEADSDENADTNLDVNVDASLNTDSSIDVENEEPLTQDSIENIE